MPPRCAAPALSYHLLNRFWIVGSDHIVLSLKVGQGRRRPCPAQRVKPSCRISLGLVQRDAGPVYGLP